MKKNRVVTILVVEQNPLDFTWCHEKDKACVEMVEEGLANGTILPPTHCNPRCSQQEFEVTNLKEKSKKVIIWQLLNQGSYYLLPDLC